MANHYTAVEAAALVCNTDHSFACAAITRTVDHTRVSDTGDMGGDESGYLAKPPSEHDFCSSTFVFPFITALGMVTCNDVSAICRQKAHCIPDDDDRDENKHYGTTQAFEVAMEPAFGLANGCSIFAGSFSHGIGCRQGAGENALVALASCRQRHASGFGGK